MVVLALINILLVLAALAGVGFLLRERQLLLRRLQALEGVRDDLTDQFRALTAGAVGQGERVNRLEEDFGGLRHRVDTMASQEASGGPTFAQAIRLVRRGASAEEVMETCGLSQMEADLMVTLHRGESAP